jgi:hypothetical protein
MQNVVIEIDLQRDFAAGVYRAEAQNFILPPPPHFHTVYMYTVPYCILIHTGKGGGGELNQREG